MRVCLIRHALTAWNEAGRIQGQTDVALSEAGRAQVAGWVLPGGFQGACCLTSPLRRARDTAALLGFVDAPTDERLAEMRWGECEGRRLGELRDIYGPAFIAAEARGLDFRPPGGESPREVAARFTACLADLAALDADHLVVAHKGILRAALVVTLGWEMVGEPPVAFEPERAILLDLTPGGAARFAGTASLRPDAA